MVGIIASIIGVLVAIIVGVVICCCCCPFCTIYKRRQHRRLLTQYRQPCTQDAGGSQGCSVQIIASQPSAVSQPAVIQQPIAVQQPAVPYPSSQQLQYIAAQSNQMYYPSTQQMQPQYAPQQPSMSYANSQQPYQTTGFTHQNLNVGVPMPQPSTGGHSYAGSTGPYTPQQAAASQLPIQGQQCMNGFPQASSEQGYPPPYSEKPPPPFNPEFGQ